MYGGLGTEDQYFSDMNILDVETTVWSTLSSEPSAGDKRKKKRQAKREEGGEGGEELANTPPSPSSSPLPSSSSSACMWPEPRARCSMVRLGQGRVVIFGGLSGEEEETLLHADSFELDMAPLLEYYQSAGE